MARTNYTNDKFVLDAIYTDYKGVIHDVDVGQELAVVVQGTSEYSLGMLTKIEWRKMCC